MTAARKDLFSKALAAPGRLHMAAHSHHLWPDVTLAAQVEAWEDAVVLADHKWDKALGEVYPAAQGLVARELNLPSPETVVFGPNTHTLLATLLSAFDRKPVRVLATDGEFHSFRRQAQRWVEAGQIELTAIDSQAPDFAERFLEAARAGGHATLFRGGDGSVPVFTPLAPALAQIHARLKREFDPAGIFGPGRLYDEF